MRDLIAIKPLTYASRRLKVGDGFTARSDRDARVLTALRKAKVVGTVKLNPDVDDGDLRSLRTEYEHVVGKKPYHGWSAEQLLEKIVAARAGE